MSRVAVASCGAPVAPRRQAVGERLRGHWRHSSRLRQRTAACQAGMRPEAGVSETSTANVAIVYGGCYPESRVFRWIFASLCEQVADPSARLVIIEKAGWFFSKSQHELRCDQR